MRKFVHYYLEGASIREAKEKAGIPLSPSRAGRILENPVYIGDGYYPPLLDPLTSQRVIEERRRRYQALGCFVSRHPAPPVPVRERFVLREEGFHAVHSGEVMTDPVRRAALIYALITPYEEGVRRIPEKERERLLKQMTAAKRRESRKEEVSD